MDFQTFVRWPLFRSPFACWHSLLHRRSIVLKMIMLRSPNQTANEIRRSCKNDQSNIFVTVYFVTTKHDQNLWQLKYPTRKSARSTCDWKLGVDLRIPARLVF